MGNSNSNTNIEPDKVNVQLSAEEYKKYQKYIHI